MRVKLAYYSIHGPDFPPAYLYGLLERAGEYNTRTGITSILAMTDTHFLHLLEGQREAVSSAFTRIMHDQNHKRVSLFGCNDTDKAISTTQAVEFIGPTVFSRRFCIESVRMPRIVPTLLNFQQVEKLLTESVVKERETGRSLTMLETSPSDDFFDISV